MPGRRRDGRKLWAADRDDGPASRHEADADVDVNPKQRKVLDVQSQAGNAAATAMVQRKSADKSFNAMEGYLDIPAAAPWKEPVEEEAAAGGIGRAMGAAAKQVFESKAKAAPASGGLTKAVAAAAKQMLEQKSSKELLEHKGPAAASGGASIWADPAVAGADDPLWKQHK